MRPLRLNLARRPFANSRPLTRATLLFWVIGGLLFGLNVLFYWRHFSGEGQSEQVMRDIAARIEAETATIGRLESEVAGLDLEGQNKLVTFLNQKVAERTFSWSSLFDDLAEVLPADVQLERVSPRIIGREPRRRERARRASRQEEVVVLSLNGKAKNGEQMLAFVDALFDHPAFREPSPTNEVRREESNDLSFSLSVLYLPRPPVAPTAPAVSEEEGGGESALEPDALEADVLGAESPEAEPPAPDELGLGGVESTDPIRDGSPS